MQMMLTVAVSHWECTRLHRENSLCTTTAVRPVRRSYRMEMQAKPRDSCRVVTQTTYRNIDSVDDRASGSWEILNIYSDESRMAIRVEYRALPLSVNHKLMMDSDVVVVNSLVLSSMTWWKILWVNLTFGHRNDGHWIHPTTTHRDDGWTFKRFKHNFNSFLAAIPFSILLFGTLNVIYSRKAYMTLRWNWFPRRHRFSWPFRRWAETRSAIECFDFHLSNQIKEFATGNDQRHVVGMKIFHVERDSLVATTAFQYFTIECLLFAPEITILRHFDWKLESVFEQ